MIWSSVVRGLSGARGHVPRANPSLSQSFLLDPTACEAIVRRSGLSRAANRGTGTEKRKKKPIDAEQRRNDGVDGVHASAIEGDVSDPRCPLVLEIGPGPGGLTRALLDGGCDVAAIEIDRRFASVLPRPVGGTTSLVDENSRHSNCDGAPSTSDGAVSRAGGSGAFLSLTFADAAKCDQGSVLSEVADPARHSSLWVAGNLPFHVASKLAAGWVKDVADLSGWAAVDPVRPTGMVLMFQREVARGIAAPARSTHRSRLSVIAQTYFDCERVMTFPGKAFTPPVKVDAEVIKMMVRINNGGAEAGLVPFDALERVVALLFQSRRKMIGSTVRRITGGAVAGADLMRAGIDPNLRPQDLETHDWQVITRMCADNLPAA